ncbi:hypothetical protein N9247_00855 [bacterium]|nr:hypothetical protein [bacterium]
MTSALTVFSRLRRKAAARWAPLVPSGLGSFWLDKAVPDQLELVSAEQEASLVTENRIRFELYATILRSQQSLVSQAIIHDR